MVSKAQIGAAGVLLVQYELLKQGFESAPMTTDAGIDLVVYAPGVARAFTVQVKACLRPKPAGGKGRPILDWWLSVESPAELVALADLESNVAWLLSHQEFTDRAQQHSPSGKLHLYLDVEADRKAKPYGHVRDFQEYRITPARLNRLFAADEAASVVVAVPLAEASSVRAVCPTRHQTSR